MPAAPVEAPVERTEGAIEPDRPWVTIVWNDPINLMTYVTFVFMTYFKYSRDKSEKLMLAVHAGPRGASLDSASLHYEADGKSYTTSLQWRMVACGRRRADGGPASAGSVPPGLCARP